MGILEVKVGERRVGDGEPCFQPAPLDLVVGRLAPQVDIEEDTVLAWEML